ncbi:MAG TPA: LD-carboxypeptidase [Flavobacteriales bacterium]|jgi:muramoyltetrapeptide carboxypeptidase|nr:LD-carboxypeptidase [Flavobacteriales bacterium]MBK6550147.1 LD-carboxypeptidase [Flavobacteriales bacterium]MBK7102657.1 LD-carboxypeptidase [Flavobacteriales bacterium]MBK7113392.1 LD-carboxypeptidase [Flavobacteriales bacterium]MBK7482606.1 LD-carboxypeptidase [Flavobacteriales bacterium]
MSTILPPALKCGDTISIIPTARAIHAEELQDGIALAESWGLRVQLGNGVGRKLFQQAGSGQERAADLQTALNDPEVRAIWCARGGYGTVHLLDHLDLSALKQDPKWIVGFSDITVLHNACRTIGIPTIHAQMPYMVGNKTTDCKESLHQALFTSVYTVDGPNATCFNEGTCEGTLVGGNISVLYSLRGTPWDLDPTGTILFLEDLDELLYHMDRMVQNLRLAGWFKQLSGLVIGGLSDMHDKNPDDPFGNTAEQIIRDAIGDVNYPVCFGFPAGHIADNRALVLGQKTKLSVTKNGASLSFGIFS